MYLQNLGLALARPKSCIKSSISPKHFYLNPKTYIPVQKYSSSSPNSLHNISNSPFATSAAFSTKTIYTSYNLSCKRSIHNSPENTYLQISTLSTPKKEAELPFSSQLPDNSKYESKNPDLFSGSIVRLESKPVTETLLQDIETEEAIHDQISIAHACLNTGNVDRGRRMITGLYNIHPEKMRSLVDVSLHNQVIKSLLEMNPVRAKDALSWYTKMQKEYHVTPDSNTFAILIHGYLTVGINSLVVLLIEEFEKKGNSLDLLVTSPYLTDSDLNKIKELSDGRFENKIGTLNSVLVKSLGLDSENAIFLDHNAQSPSNDPSLNSNTPSTQQSTPNVKIDTQKIGLTMFNKLAAKLKPDETPIPQAAGVPESTSDLPKPISVKSTKGEVLGVKLLKKMLDPLYKSEFSLYERQVLLETEAFDAAASRMKATSSMHGDGLLNLQGSTVQKLMAKWLPSLAALIEDEVKRCDLAVGSDRERAFYSPFLKLLPPEKIATVVVMEFVRTVMNRVISGDGVKGPPDSVVISRLVTHIGKSIQTEYNLVSLKKKENSHLLARDVEIQNLSANGKLFNIAVRNAQAKMQDELNKTSTWIPKWPVLVTVKLGSLFTAMLIEVAKIDVSVLDTETNTYITQKAPAFTHGYWINKGYKTGVIKVHNEFSSLLTDEPVKELFNTRFLPMIVPPRPWLSYNNGGYLTYQTYCMRTKSSAEQANYLEHSSKQDKLSNVLSGLDVLGLTKWAINKPVFEVVLKVWNSGEGLAGIPPSVVKVNEPEKPDNIENNPKVFHEWANKVKQAKRDFANNHSTRCDVNYKVAIAHAFLDLPLYFPHDLDFRGRAYPIPPHFNNLGNDLCRGLLRFHDPKPLGERGLHWLRIQLANSFGYDKFSHDERVAFSIDNYDKILDSAKNPLDGQRWWMESENPWQTLAACFELVAALESGDPTNFLSSLHVHQDGTCNGLQHYAALGRDLEGAKKVNLVTSDRPQDVYSAILEIVEKEIENDCASNIREAQLLKGKIKRKVIKQTVMTNVYGVTIIGAREQIEARLKEIVDPVTNLPIYEFNDLRKLSLYLAKKVFLSLGRVFECARLIQDWLNEAANRVAKSLPPESFNLQKKLKSEKYKRNKLLRASKKSAKSDSNNASVGAVGADSNLPASDLSIPDNTTDITVGTAVEPLQESPEAIKPAYKLAKTSTILFKRKSILDELIAKPMSSVTWTTPLGLTVVQPYRKFVVRNIKSTLQTLAIIDRNIPSPVHSRKQSTAFPPNFVHSLDASHMILSALSCYKKGITFASVHDSYWTHACDVDLMNDVLRAEFVKLHSNDIMENLKAEFETRYGDFLIPITETKMVDPKPAKSKSSKKNKKSAKEKTSNLEAGSNAIVSENSSGGIDELPSHLQDVFEDNDTDLQHDDDIEKKELNDASDDAVEGSLSVIDNEANLKKTDSNSSNQKIQKTIKWVPFCLPDLPKTGELNIKEVLNSPYFFS
ncbi:DNA-directed RNA polymerase, mitochondrial [Smittium culicis]|uniref:DNA-directed RNA polymerase n=1 Tax=Smittium culicis TaxID=133412 RepID=A0A1R1YCF2_9FUNG|nr:DNA-directed RNA polymerase, mitochondrial [Smittium culicis]